MSFINMIISSTYHIPKPGINSSFGGTNPSIFIVFNFSLSQIKTGDDSFLSFRLFEWLTLLDFQPWNLQSWMADSQRQFLGRNFRKYFFLRFFWKKNAFFFLLIALPQRKNRTNLDSFNSLKLIKTILVDLNFFNELKIFLSWCLTNYNSFRR